MIAWVAVAHFHKGWTLYEQNGDQIIAWHRPRWPREAKKWVSYYGFVFTVRD